jgi:hypothetical protein
MPEPPGPAPEAVYGTKEFYKWHAEDFKRRHPGKEPPPYYMDYGDKYARVFSDEIRGRLSDKGKQWVDNTRRTLQRRIEEKLASGEMDELDPQEFERMAFAMHANAYQEAGIDDLPLSDAVDIMQSVDANAERPGALATPSSGPGRARRHRPLYRPRHRPRPRQTAPSTLTFHKPF